MEEHEQEEEPTILVNSSESRDPRSQVKYEYDPNDPQENEVPVLNIVIPPEFAQQSEANMAVNIPLFLRKLWKMVNDPYAEDIISWNASGDGFIIYDQLEFISKLLPKYFKHNHLASFIRQLNLYDFHKVANIDKDEMHFTHQYFLKDLPQMLSFIKRKSSSGRHKEVVADKNVELNGVLDNIKQMKSKHEVISNELQRLQQENSALWKEMNSLRMKHLKQTKIINKLIHFLISYVHSHHASNKNKKGVNKHLKAGPKLLELDYHKEKVDELCKATGEKNIIQLNDNYTVTEPDLPAGSSLNTTPGTTESSSSIPQQQSSLPQPSVSNALEQRALPEPSVSNALEQRAPSPTFHIPTFDLSELNTLDSVAPPRNAAPPHNVISLTGKKPKENLGLYIDNSQVELDSIQEMLKNLTPNDLASFCDLVNENCSNQLNELTEGVSTEVSPGAKITETNAEQDYISNFGSLAEFSGLNQVNNMNLTENVDQHLMNELECVSGAAASPNVDDYFTKEPETVNVNILDSDDEQLMNQLDDVTDISAATNIDDYFTKKV